MVFPEFIVMTIRYRIHIHNNNIQCPVLTYVKLFINNYLNYYHKLGNVQSASSTILVNHTHVHGKSLVKYHGQKLHSFTFHRLALKKKKIKIDLMFF